MNQAARLFGDIYPYISTDIFKLCRFLNFNPTWQQEQLLGAVQRGDTQVAIKSGKGPGKTRTLGIVAMFRCLKAIGAFCVLSSPTMRQNKLWIAEFRRLVENADPLAQAVFNVTQTKVEIAGVPDWGILAVTANRVENAQGFHHPHLTLMVDEASGVDREIIQAFRDTATNPNCLFVMAGNPNSRDCAFFDCFNKNAPDWTKITWNSEQTPKSVWFDPIRNEKLAQEFGRDSDIYRIAVLGEFPHADPNCVLSSEDLYKLVDRKLMRDASLAYTNGRHVKQFGLDFARFGGDECTIFRRSGNAIVEWDFFTHQEPSVAVERAFRMQRNAAWRNDQCWYVPDAGGIGQGVMHLFYDEDKQVVEFHNGGTAVQSEKFGNLMTEAWFGLAGKIRSKEKLYLPDDPILLQQLAGRQYFINNKGLMVLESKEDYMDRGHESPDRADGLMMSMYDEVIAKSQMSTTRDKNRTVGHDLIRE